MQYQCPQCYSYEIGVSKPKNFWIWLALMVVIDVGIVLIIISGAVENPTTLIIALIVADMLLTLPLMRALMSRKDYPNGAMYQCVSCGHQWTENGSIATPASAPVTEPISVPQMHNATLNTSGFEMTIQDVFAIKGRGTVVTGQVEDGKVTAGEALELHHAGHVTQVIVDGIEMSRRTLDSAKMGDNVGLLLRSVGKDDVSRGDVLKGTY